MKGEIRKKYQEFVNHIDFPAIIYVYENNKILASNSYSKSLIGEIEDIRKLFVGKKFKLPRELIKGGSKLFLNIECCDANKKIISLDMDINVFKVDNVNFILMFFEDSFKDCFVGQLSFRSPRVSWRYLSSDLIFMNSALINDILSYDYRQIDRPLELLEPESMKKMLKIEKKIINSGESQYNSIQMVNIKDKTSRFIEVNWMPIINNSAENIGILSVHNKILNREKHNEIYDTALKSNNIVNEIIDKGDTIFVSWLNDENNTIQYISSNIEKYGYQIEDFCTGRKNFQDIIYPEDYEIIRYRFKSNALQGEDIKTTEYEYRIIKSNGEIVWVHEECTPVVLNNNVNYYFSSLKDISKRKNKEAKKTISQKNNKELEETYNILVQILDNIDSCIFVISHGDYIIRFANKKMKSNYGEDIIGNEFFEFLIKSRIESCIDTEAGYTDINSAINYAINSKEYNLDNNISKFYDNVNNKYFTAKIENIKWIDGEELLLITMNELLSDKIHIKDESNLYRDPLTGLPNRAQYLKDARVSIKKAVEKNKNGAVILFNLDDFKHINYRYGHKFGEEFIKKVSEKINQNTNIKNCTYRCRGVEFLVIIDCDKELDIESISESIVNSFNRKWKIGDKQVYCSLSVGITMFPRDGINPLGLIANAELAMYEAKKKNDKIKAYYATQNYLLTIKQK